MEACYRKQHRLIKKLSRSHLRERPPQDPPQSAPPVPGKSPRRRKRLLKLIDSWGADGLRRHPVLFRGFCNQGQCRVASACTHAAFVVSGRPGGVLQVGEPMHGVDGGVAAHLAGGLQTGADCGAGGVSEDAAAHLGVELNAGDAGGLAVWHARDRTGDRWGDAAGAAARPTARFGAAGHRRSGQGGRHGWIVRAGGVLVQGRLKSQVPPPVSVRRDLVESRGVSQRGFPPRSGRDGSGHAQ